MRSPAVCVLLVLLSLPGSVLADGSAQTSSPPPPEDRRQPFESHGGDGANRDYVLRTDAMPAGPRIRPLAQPKPRQEPCPDCAERVLYESFTGLELERVLHRGRFVQVLLSDDWVDGLGPEGIRLFIDLADLTYSYMTQATGREPAGDGLLPIAVVPETCSGRPVTGCGFLGHKGVELIGDEVLLNESIWDTTLAGFPYNVLVHELAHNFDFYSGRLGTTEDPPHFWTELFSVYIRSWARFPLKELGRQGQVFFASRVEDLPPARPDELIEDFLARVHWPYLETPGATWQTCVRDVSCPHPNVSARQLRASLALRVFQLFGPRAFERFLARMNELQQERPTPATPEEREDEYVEALAAAAQADLGCVVDQWRWFASPDARDRMAADHPPADLLCADGDGDGSSPLLGDCDDQDPLVHPDADEQPNGRDDDCDGAADEAIASVPDPSVGIEEPVPGPPVEVETAVLEGVAPAFSFTAAAARRLKLTLCSPLSDGFRGAAGLSSPAGSPLGGVAVDEGICAIRFLRARGGPDYRLQLVRSGTGPDDPGAGDAEVRLEAEPAPFPTPEWGFVEVEELPENRFRLEAVTQTLTGTLRQPDRVRFWVSGFGWVGGAPYQEQVSSVWQPTVAIDPEMLQFRAQLFHGSTPVSAYSLRNEPLPPFDTWMRTEELPGFEFQVRIGGAGPAGRPGRQEADCLSETLCVGGAIPGRSELFLRVVGPKPNGYLWPNLVKFSTAEVEAWVRRRSTGEVRHYRLPSVAPGQDILDLSGLADREGFRAETSESPAVALSTSAARTPTAAPAAEAPPPPEPTWLATPELPGFSFQVRISTARQSRVGTQERECLGETLCVSGAIPGRSEVFLRIVGPKPNGRLWVNVVKFSTSRIEVWARQDETDEIRYYDLPGVSPGERLLDLTGLADKLAFLP